MNMKNLSARFIASVTIALLIITHCEVSGQLPNNTLDLVIRNGKIMDGTGNPYFFGDIGVRDGKIVAVGELSDVLAGRVIDASGKIVAPGFIDIHTHGEPALADANPALRAAPSDAYQGVTTVVVNQCGGSPLSIKDQITELMEKKTGLNVLTLVGHNTIRREVMGEDNKRPATEAEIEEMRALVRKGMEEGAFGLSVGLEYEPGKWSTTEEVIALVEEIVPFGGIFHNHPRSQGDFPKWYWPSIHDPHQPTLIDAVKEHLEIGEKTGATVVLSHIKARGRSFHGASEIVINLFNDARARGVSAYAELYPYNTSGSDGRDPVVPLWLEEYKRDNENYAGLLTRFLQDPEKERDIRMDISHEINRRGGADVLTLVDHPDSELAGMTLREMAEMKGISDIDMAIELQMSGDHNILGGVSIRGFSMSEKDVENYIKQPWTATGSDGRIRVEELDDGSGHPRWYGTFPRMIRVYAIEREVITVEEAVRSMTSLPAQIYGIMDRGLIREGMNADIVVFDPERINDRADAFNPAKYSQGIDYLMVNGVLTVDGGNLTGELPGKVLTP